MLLAKTDLRLVIALKKDQYLFIFIKLTHCIPWYTQYLKLAEIANYRFYL